MELGRLSKLIKYKNVKHLEQGLANGNSSVKFGYYYFGKCTFPLLVRFVFQPVDVNLKTCDHNEKFQKVSRAPAEGLTWLQDSTLRNSALDAKVFDGRAEEGERNVSSSVIFHEELHR